MTPDYSGKRAGSNYETVALPLSYTGEKAATGLPGGGAYLREPPAIRKPLFRMPTRQM